MNEEKKQNKPPMRFTEEELLTIRNTFKDNQSLLKTIRKVMLQLPLNVVDLSILEITFKNKAVQKVVRKILLPTIDSEAPITQVIDFWLTIPLKEMPPEVATLHIQSVKLWRDYTDQQLKVFETGKYQEEQEIKLKDLEDIKDKLNDNMYIDMLARNTIINNTEQQLNGLLVLGSLEHKTDEEIAEDRKKNSNK